MLVVYPASLETDEDGRILVRFPDLPGAATDGADRAEALGEARDCLNSVLSILMRAGEAVPPPSPVQSGQVAVAPDAALALKAALHMALRDAAITVADLARRLGVDEREARRLLDPDHASRLSALDAAIAALGRRVTIDVAA